MEEVFGIIIIIIIIEVIDIFTCLVDKVYNKKRLAVTKTMRYQIWMQKDDEYHLIIEP